jgi:hypothetical protein
VIEGRIIRESDGDPVGYAKVRAYVAGTREWVATGYGNDAGEYRILGLKPGDYQVYVDATNSPGGLESAWLGGTRVQSQSPVITLPGASTGHDLALGAGASLGGTLTDAKYGLPLAGVTVQLFGEDGVRIRSTTTGQSGHYVFSWLPEGEYRVRVKGVPATTPETFLTSSFSETLAEKFPTPAWQEQWFSGASTIEDATSIDLVSGQRRLDVDMAVFNDNDVTVPGAPTEVAAVAGNGSASVSWTAPASTVGAPITGYTVTSTPGGKTCTTTGATSCTVAGLANGTAHTFTVIARNAAGTGAESPSSTAVTPLAPATAPGAPTGVTAVAGTHGAGSATVVWGTPDNGGSPITGYTVTAHPGGQTWSSGSTSTHVFGLTLGTLYRFTVVAHNAVGSSPESGASDPVVSVTTPGVPQWVTIAAVHSSSPTDATATVAWDAPADGGSPITGYTVTMHPGGQTQATTGTSATFSGLRPGTSYSFTVVAHNSAGSSSAGSAGVTPPAPAVRVAVKPVSSNGKLSVNVDPNRGSGYYTFKVQYKDKYGRWRTYRSTYKTYGSGETRTLNFGKGTYRVVVNGKYGYQGATSSEVYLRK